MSATVFIIDDNPIDCFIAEKLIKLTHTGSQVTTFTNPQQALELLQSLSNHTPADFPQVIFLDINMPLMDGWAFLEQYQTLSAQLIGQCSLFMLSSSSNALDVDKAKTYAFIKAYFSKPFSMDIVAHASVKTVLV